MNFSKLVSRTYSYLGARSAGRNKETDGIIEECLEELEKLSHFRYIYKFFKEPPDFLNAQPYADYLKGNSGVIVAVMTLGGEVDRRIKFYERTDAARAVVFDACASAYLEELSDGFESGLGLNLSYRFCPGYGGSSVGDLKHIFRILSPEKAGIGLTENNFMLPCKSMAGIIAVGNSTQKSCENCTVFGHCEYRKEGSKCYGSEKK